MNQTSTYLQFLPFCLDEKQDAPPACTKDINWHDLLSFAKKQAVAGIYWQGIMRLGNLKENKPTDDDVLEWMAAYKKIEKSNRLLFEKTAWLSKKFEQEGFPNCILKGQGNALLYPNPYCRTSGDIDIWLQGGREKILNYVSQFCNLKNLYYHQVGFPIVKKVEVEIHFMPSYLENPFLNKKLQHYFKQQEKRQFGHHTEEENGQGGFNSPTIDFNLFYQMLHLHKHIRHEGIGLRQLIDYYYLLLSAKEDDFKGLNTLLDRFDVLKTAKGILYVLQEVMALDSSKLYAEPDKEEGSKLLEAIIRGGNFGKYDPDVELWKSKKSHLARFLCREKLRLAKTLRYPSETLWLPLHELYVHYFIIKRYERKYNKHEALQSEADKL